MGRVPDWYPLIRAARYLGVKPWELEEMPPKWFWQALAAEKAENAAQRDRAKHE